jgi:hypothetical protein
VLIEMLTNGKEDDDKEDEEKEDDDKENDDGNQLLIKNRKEE